MLGLGDVRQGFHGRTQHVVQAEDLQVEDDFALSGPIEFEQILNQFDLEVCVPLNNIGCADHDRIRRCAQHATPSENRRERSPQLVREHR